MWVPQNRWFLMEHPIKMDDLEVPTFQETPISYHIISYHIISYHIISYHTVSYHVDTFLRLFGHVQSKWLNYKCHGSTTN